MNQVQSPSHTLTDHQSQSQQSTQTDSAIQTTTVPTNQTQSSSQNSVPVSASNALQTSQQPTSRWDRAFCLSLPFTKPQVTDDRYDCIKGRKLEDYPRGYPSVAAFIATDIDGPVYRRFGYVRNRLLLQRQDEIFHLQGELDKIDYEDANGDKNTKKRLTSRMFDESEQPNSRRKEVMKLLETTMKEYDDLLLREHQIMSIKKAPKKLHKGLFDFILNGKIDGNRTLKHLQPDAREFMNDRDDFLILGNQDDAWLGSYVESIQSLIPRKLRDLLLASKDDRQKGKDSNISFYSNDRINKFVKAIVCAATTILLILPIILLYVLSVHNASGGLKIGVLLIFTVAFVTVLAAITNATRSEMFGASAGYCVGLIVFLTWNP